MKEKKIKEFDDVVIKFAGDSGDGIQLMGYQFTYNSAFAGNEAVNYPEFPSEIRAPRGTLAGVSSFQLHFSNHHILTPGDECDVLVAMNAAALKVSLKDLKKGGIIIANADGFDEKNLQLAKYEKSPLDEKLQNDYEVHIVPISTLTKEALKNTQLTIQDKERCKNMFALGLVYWLFNRKIDNTISFLKNNFSSKPEILDANIIALKAGYNYGEISDSFHYRYYVSPSKLPKGRYRGITGNHAIALGLLAAANVSGLPLFYASYPITPASEILKLLSTYINLGVKTFQAEDEIAAICASIGASFGGSLSVTGTSGPGLALKTESINLALMLELPLVIINVQRAGPSTGIPTKTEQSDLLYTLYGRPGESPLPVLSASSPSDCFYVAFEACRIALEFMTPVIMLSDAYIANGAEAWKFPAIEDLPKINVKIVKNSNNNHFLPYKRDERLVRNWALPGNPHTIHRIGSLEKEPDTGNVNYTPENHQIMSEIRQKKIENIANFIPKQKIDNGVQEGDLLILGWGSTYGVIKSVVDTLNKEGYKIGHLHLKYMNPLPPNIELILKNFKKILVPELNSGHLKKIIRERFLLPVIGLNKIQGVPITHKELKEKAIEIIKNHN